MMTEEWKIIKDFPNYMVSNLGNVKSLNYENLQKVKILKPMKQKSYYIVRLYKNKKWKDFFIHKLVADMFLKKPKYAECVNHINGNKLDNNVNNLEWCTHSYNTKEAYRLGLKKPNSKPIKQLNNNFETIAIWNNAYEVNKKLGYNPSHINEVCNGKRRSANGYIWAFLKKGEKE